MTLLQISAMPTGEKVLLVFALSAFIFWGVIQILRVFRHGEPEKPKKRKKKMPVPVFDFRDKHDGDGMVFLYKGTPKIEARYINGKAHFYWIETNKMAADPMELPQHNFKTIENKILIAWESRKGPSKPERKPLRQRNGEFDIVTAKVGDNPVKVLSKGDKLEIVGGKKKQIAHWINK